MTKVYKVKGFNQYYSFSDYILNRPCTINDTWDCDKVTNSVKFTRTVSIKDEPPVRKKLEDYM